MLYLYGKNTQHNKLFEMKTFRFFIVAMFLMAGLTGCKTTGMKALKQGNYYTACIQAIDKLRSSPDNSKAKEALSKAYSLAIDYTEKEAERLRVARSDNSRHQKTFDLYASMNDIAMQISRSPSALRVIPNANYYNQELETARNRAAEESYQLAETYFRAGNRAAARQAHQQFVRTHSIMPGYKDVESKMEEAKWMAIVKVVLEQAPVEGSYKLSADFFQQKVYEYFANNIRNEYIAVFSPEEVRTMRIVPDQKIRLRFLDFVVGQKRERTNTYEVKKDSVITGTYKDNRGVTHNVYGTVKAKITERKAEISSSGVLEAFIIDYKTNNTLSQQRFPGTFVWSDSYASFNGDERALSKKQLDMCKRTSFVPPPPPQELFMQFTNPIYNNLTRFIQNYYKNY